LIQFSALVLFLANTLHVVAGFAHDEIYIVGKVGLQFGLPGNPLTGVKRWVSKAKRWNKRWKKWGNKPTLSIQRSSIHEAFKPSFNRPQPTTKISILLWVGIFLPLGPSHGWFWALARARGASNSKDNVYPTSAAGLAKSAADRTMAKSDRNGNGNGNGKWAVQAGAQGKCLGHRFGRCCSKPSKQFFNGGPVFARQSAVGLFMRDNTAWSACNFKIFFFPRASARGAFARA
jgi:hypothetical protein